MFRSRTLDALLQCYGRTMGWGWNPGRRPGRPESRPADTHDIPSAISVKGDSKTSMSAPEGDQCEMLRACVSGTGTQPLESGVIGLLREASGRTTGRRARCIPRNSKGLLMKQCMHIVPFRNSRCPSCMGEPRFEKNVLPAYSWETHIKLSHLSYGSISALHWSCRIPR